MTDYQGRLRAIVVGDERLDSERSRGEVMREFGVTTQQLESDIAATQQRLDALPVAVYCCGGAACCQKKQSLPEVPGIPVIGTSCLGPCKQGPVVKLKVRGEEQLFAGVNTPERAQSTIDFARRAAQRGSLMVDSGSAQELLMDPHHPDVQPPEMVKMQFLAGQFRGEGQILETGETFIKEVEGRWESTGRFLSLRQRASYGDDVHSAIVMIGVERAVAFRDDGTEHAYYPHWVEGSLLFDDRVPHRAHALWARKRITPHESGYSEVLEITRDGQNFIPYYTVEHRRLEVCHANV
jgi:(2Fe-2S) ferredoxin